MSEKAAIVPTYEIGIPVHSNLRWAIETTERALSVAGVTSVHVSVNDPSQANLFRDQFPSHPLVRLSIQNKPLGLYGNLRFLANSSSAKFFSWLCLDDKPDKDFFIREVLGKESPLTSLYVPRIAQQDFDDVRQWHGPTQAWESPASHSQKPFEWKVFFGNRTHYIFGIWETRYLCSIFPARNFDWLDAYLLARATVDGRISHFESGTLTVGASNKLPHRVGRKHRISGWLCQALRLVFKSRRPLRAFRWYVVAGITQSHINHYWNTREKSQTASKH